MSDEVTRYERFWEPVWSMAEAIMPPDTVKDAKSAFAKPCQMMIRVAEITPDNLLAAGTAVAKMNKRAIRRGMNTPRYMSKKQLEENISILIELITFFAEMGKQGSTLADFDKQLGDMLTDQYEKAVEMLDKEYSSVIAPWMHVDRGEIGQVLVGFLWQAFAGDIQSGLTSKMKEFLEYDPHDLVKSFEKIVWFIDHAEEQQSKDFCRYLVHSWLRKEYGINEDDYRSTKNETTLYGESGFVQPDVHSSLPLQEEETDIDSQSLVERIVSKEKPRVRALLPVQIEYANKEISKEEYEKRLAEIGYTPTGARQAMHRLRKKHPDLQQKLKALK